MYQVTLSSNLLLKSLSDANYYTPLSDARKLLEYSNSLPLSDSRIFHISNNLPRYQTHVFHTFLIN